MHPATDSSVQRLIGLLQEKQGFDILLMDLRQVTDTADYFILCSGNSDQHVRALADEVMEMSKAAGDAAWHVEGYATRRWVLIDFVHVVVHIFRREAREFYALERLWGDAVCTRFADPLDAGPVATEVATADSVFSRS